MSDYRTHKRTDFTIPEEAQRLIAEWQSKLPVAPTMPHWQSRYRYSFVDNGVVDQIVVNDAMSGEVFTWTPPLEQW